GHEVLAHLVCCYHIGLDVVDDAVEDFQLLPVEPARLAAHLGEAIGPEVSGEGQRVFDERIDLKIHDGSAGSALSSSGDSTSASTIGLPLSLFSMASVTSSLAGGCGPLAKPCQSKMLTWFWLLSTFTSTIKPSSLAIISWHQAIWSRKRGSPTRFSRETLRR